MLRGQEGKGAGGHSMNVGGLLLRAAPFGEATVQDVGPVVTRSGPLRRI